MLSTKPQRPQGPLSKAFSLPKSEVNRSQIAPSDGFSAYLTHVCRTSSNGKQRENDRQGQATTLPTLRIDGGEIRSSSSSHTTQVDKSAADRINSIGRAIRAIYATPLEQSGGLDAAGMSYESLYHSVEVIISASSIERCEELFDRVKLEMERAIGQFANALRAGMSVEVVSNDASMQRAWLKRLCDAWTGWCERTTLSCHILTLLDQVYLATHGLPSLWQLSMDLFKHSIAGKGDLHERMLNDITGVSYGIREGMQHDYRSLHAILLSMITTLSLYEHVETALLDSTQKYFAFESNESIKSMDGASYLAHAEQKLQQEVKIVEWLFVEGKGRTRSLKIVRQEMFKQHATLLIDGLATLLDQSPTSSLSLLYKFLSSVEELPSLRSSFGKYIREKGEEIVTDKAKDDVMIETLLEYKARIDNIVKVAFHGDADFRQTQKESFETFVNKRENKAAELIAKFLDARLRSGNKTMSDQEMEHTLNEALILFRYTHAKDMFEEFYKRLFAKRLLLNRSASSDAEQSMLLKLKEECGAAFTQKLETMSTDVALSDEMMKAYTPIREKEVLESAAEQHTAPGSFDLNVNVLTQAHWPTFPQVDVIIPASLQAATESFSRFYETRNQGRKLQWAHSLGTTSLTAHFAKAGEKELLVSTFQTVILLLFNDVASDAKLSYAQIKEQTGLEDKELKRTLQSLACGQIPTRVLRKEPQGKEVNEEDLFGVNEQLKNERKRIRINMIQLNETQEEQKSTVDRVMFDRELVLQASAVRILKAKKTIKHAELLQEVVQAIAPRFSVDVGEIKKTFEILIDKEYMERVEGQRGVYRYLA